MNALRGLREAGRRLGATLPDGRSLPEEQWRARHRALVWLLCAHVVVIPVVSVADGGGNPLADGAIVALFAALALVVPGGRRTRSIVVALGLLTCSALLVEITGGATAARFHFFVMVAALSLYEDWVPFLVAVVYVLFDEGPVPALFIAALCLALLVSWRASESDRIAFRSLVETLEEGVLMVSRSGALIAANPSAARTLGMDPAEVLVVNGSQPAWTFVTPDGTPFPDDERPMRVTARTGRPRVAVPMGLRRADGTTRWLSVTTRAVDAGEAAGPYTVVISFTDVTEEREALDALERSNAELQQFAYIASHDLSEPLRMVSSYLQLLRRRYHGRLDEDADEFIDYAVDGATRMRSLIEGLLAYSRAGRGEESEAVDLNFVAGDVLRSLAAAIVEAEAEVEVGDLPLVTGNRLQLEQLLQNLVANALKFRGDGPAWVRVTGRPSGAGLVELEVEDGGIGIEPQHRERVFKMFQRLHDRESYEGTGIGLAICRKIVERHGGRIWVEDREGGGTVFRFTLAAAADGSRSDAAVAVVSA